MRVLNGTSLQGQIVMGRLHFYHRPMLYVERCSKRTPEEEDRRYDWALQRSIQELTVLHDRAAREVGEDNASIFSIHAMLLQDEDCDRQIRAMIREEKTTAEYASYTVGTQVAESFSKMESEYMRARGVDIQDITRRMVMHLLNMTRTKCVTKQASIVVAESFLPSEVMELDRRWLLGLISTKGSVNSHTAELLRAYRIPTLGEIELGPEWDGRLALIDGFANCLYLDPDEEIQERLRLNYQEGGKPFSMAIP